MAASYMGLVSFSCGCIGWPAAIPDPPGQGGQKRRNRRALVIEHCDYDRRDAPGGPLSPGWRSMADKTTEPLDADKELALIDEIGRLLHGGYKLDALRSILTTLD